jgi:hypothetical protein
MRSCASFPYRDVAGCEVDQIARITAAGFIADCLPLGDRSGCLGEHGKHYTPPTIFRRWQRVSQTRRRLSNMKWMETWARAPRPLDRDRDIFHLYALGAIAGIGEPFATREPDLREPNAALARVELYFPLKE